MENKYWLKYIENMFYPTWSKCPGFSSTNYFSNYRRFISLIHGKQSRPIIVCSQYLHRKTLVCKCYGTYPEASFANDKKAFYTVKYDN